MNIWIIMIVLGLFTFATRLSFIALLERINMPRNFQRALRFVPIAVLSAIIAPELGYSNNLLALSPTNPRLWAGLVATLVAFVGGWPWAVSVALGGGVVLAVLWSS
ncbi:MAG: AzlD domain-containing protein, partial [Chloroflexi bacterium]|nr:AzlD domain-containing protein [Chloroflexota bacterium]